MSTSLIKPPALVAGFGLWLLLIIVYVLYLPGQHGALHFDDEVNLQGLGHVHDSATALIFVTSGEAGDVSRLLALASFLLNLGDWPHNPQGFLYINSLIHLLNGALLAWLTLRLLRLVGIERAEWITLGTAALWLLSPLLASTSLIIIQRMTSLCATFVMAGLLVYVIGLTQEAAGRVKQGRWLQGIGIVAGTLLATLSKENGALLPLYALILEATVLSGVASIGAWRRWRMLGLALPPLALLIYLAGRLSPAAFAARDFNMVERLLTEPIILWDYLRLALLPYPSAFSPFHDDYPIAQGMFDPPTAFIAIAAWLILIGLACWKRRRWPWFALAVLWYLGGHSLESTALPLELYFEHRNYVPLFGPALALAWWLLAGQTDPRGQQAAPVLLAVYGLMLAVVLWQTTSLWGQQFVAAEIWAARHPTSPRALQFLAQRYVMLGERDKAYAVLARTAADNPRRIDLAMQALQLACHAGREAEVQQHQAQVSERLADGLFSNAAMEALSILLDLREQGRCTALSNADLHRMADNLLANPRYQAGNARHTLHHIKSRLYRWEKSLDGTVRHLEEAFNARPEIGTAVIIVGTFLSGGLREEALAFIAKARPYAPTRPALRAQWMSLLDQLQQQIEAQLGNERVNPNPLPVIQP